MAGLNGVVEPLPAVMPALHAAPLVGRVVRIDPPRSTHTARAMALDPWGRRKTVMMAGVAMVATATIRGSYPLQAPFFGGIPAVARGPLCEAGVLPAASHVLPGLPLSRKRSRATVERGRLDVKWQEWRRR